MVRGGVTSTFSLGFQTHIYKVRSTTKWQFSPIGILKDNIPTLMATGETSNTFSGHSESYSLWEVQWMSWSYAFVDLLTRSWSKSKYDLRQSDYSGPWTCLLVAYKLRMLFCFLQFLALYKKLFQPLKWITNCQSCFKKKNIKILISTKWNLICNQIQKKKSRTALVEG